MRVSFGCHFLGLYELLTVFAECLAAAGLCLTWCVGVLVPFLASAAAPWPSGEAAAYLVWTYLTSAAAGSGEYTQACLVLCFSHGERRPNCLPK